MASFIDLFCGCGGFSLGLAESGHDLVAGFDSDSDAVKSFSGNFPGRGVRADITDLQLPEGCADILVAGLPCQGFSTLGKRRRDDPRNRLWKHFLRLVSEVGPKAGCVENVVPFLDSDECESLREGLVQEGYSVNCGRVNALHFGVAQRRVRGVMIFARGGEPGIPAGDPELVSTVRGALDGLPLEPDGENDHEPRNHRPRTMKRFQHVDEGGTRHDLPERLLSACWKETQSGAATSFGRLWWNRPADTLRTVFLKPETGRFIHPEADRGLTVREGARLQGFEDEDSFYGSMESRARQIGNAFPPPVAKAVGDELSRALEKAGVEAAA